ncbi:hypothetical protein [Marinomonas sp. 2405UD68-3]|uniref:hypothetical protein n=1 Tax=Marinomonas sp. 2405UD68-3 TaxID=3391835 RepID=UPI0039C90A15
MSDLSQEHERMVSEPDENVLIEALRNQDDIPILMDIVGEHVSLSLNQETYFSKKMESESKGVTSTSPLDSSVSVTTVPVDQAPITSFSGVDSAQLQSAIKTVIERLLPTIVEEVIKELTLTSEKAR